jgi:hypothetical protein
LHVRQNAVVPKHVAHGDEQFTQTKLPSGICPRGQLVRHEFCVKVSPVPQDKHKVELEQVIQGALQGVH